MDAAAAGEKEEKELDVRTDISVQLLMNYNTEENIRKCRERLDEIEHLPEGWDGYGGAVPEKLVCDNARTFFQTLVDNNCLVPHYEDIHPTPYGSIVIDVYPDEEDKDLVSMEIGRRQCGFFTDYQHGINSGSDGYDTNFRHIPYFLNEHINLELIKMNKFLKSTQGRPRVPLVVV